jgi:hypothetical protein
MKKLEALIAAMIITSLVGIAMVSIGINALLNPNSTPPGDSPAGAPAAIAAAGFGQTQDQVAQLTELVAQYEAREQQYQAQLDEAGQRLSQAEGEVQQLRQVLVELQNRGVIRIGNDGTIQVFGGQQRVGDGD